MRNNDYPDALGYGLRARADIVVPEPYEPGGTVDPADIHADVRFTLDGHYIGAAEVSRDNARTIGMVGPVRYLDSERARAVMTYLVEDVRHRLPR